MSSISLFSLLKGVFIPISGLSENRSAELFKFHPGQNDHNNKDIMESFFDKQIGLSLKEKIGLLVGDPFYGGITRIGEDTLLGILSSLLFIPHQELRKQLAYIGDIGALFVKGCKKIRSDPPVTSSEALVILRNLPKSGTNQKKFILRDFFLRCGRLERYFIAKLILRRLHFGYEKPQQAYHKNTGRKI